MRLPASGQDQTATYVTMTNTGAKNDRLVGATSPMSKKLELHAHSKTPDGVIAMRQLAFIELPAGSTIALVPGGLHIMVKQVRPGLKIGETIPVKLNFASGATASLQVPIVSNPRAQPQTPAKGKQGHQH